MNPGKRLGWHSLGASFDCPCGVRHSLPIAACHIGGDAARKLAQFARARKLRTALVLADENTRNAGGERLLRELGAAGIRALECILPGAAPDATQELSAIVEAAGRDSACYIGLGAGTVCDLVKSAGSAQGKPVLLFPTAASMNGYTSAIVALKVRGLKRTLPCAPATGVFADPAVAATAPRRMAAAGVADFLSKCSSAADWRAAHLLRGGYYCRRPREFNEGIQSRLFAAAPAIGRGEPEGIRLVLEALLLSGFGMVVAGSSAPASGGEHLISHYLDMRHALHGGGHDLHGVQVGVATVYTLQLWERVLALRANDIDARALAAAHPGEREIRDEILEDWGPAVGAEVLAQWKRKALAKTALRAEIERIRGTLPQFRAELLEDLVPAEVVARVIEECGGPSTPAGMHAPRREYRNALKRARYLRDRFTILDLAAELGIA